MSASRSLPEFAVATALPGGSGSFSETMQAAQTTCPEARPAAQANDRRSEGSSESEPTRDRPPHKTVPQDSGATSAAATVPVAQREIPPATSEEDRSGTASVTDPRSANGKSADLPGPMLAHTAGRVSGTEVASGFADAIDPAALARALGESSTGDTPATGDLANQAEKDTAVSKLKSEHRDPLPERQPPAAQDDPLRITENSSGKQPPSEPALTTTQSSPDGDPTADLWHRGANSSPGLAAPHSGSGGSSAEPPIQVSTTQAVPGTSSTSPAVAPSANSGKSDSGTANGDSKSADARATDRKRGGGESAHSSVHDDKLQAAADGGAPSTSSSTAAVSRATELNSRFGTSHAAADLGFAGFNDTQHTEGTASADAQSATQAHTPVHDPSDADVPGSVGMSSAVNAAKLTEHLKDSEISLNLRSAEFGNVAIHTAMSHQRLSAQISLEHGDLGKTLEGAVPTLQSKLSQDHGIEATIEVQQQAQSSNGGGGQSNGYAYRPPQPGQLAVGAEPAEPHVTAAAVEEDGHLDVRI